MSYIDGKVAIVTGAASGIGKAIAVELARRGAKAVVVADVNAALAEQAAHEIGAVAAARTVDVTDPAAVQRVVDETAGSHGRLDLMFNNAGIVVFGDVRDMSLDDWNRQIDVNLRGVVHGIAAAYPVMIRQRAGHIVNTASAAGLGPSPGGTGYCATKHAVVGLSTSLRAEAERYGVRVSVLCPGFIDTPIKYSGKFLHAVTTEEREKLLREFPMKLYPPERVARAVCDGIARNKPIIPVTPEAHIAWWIYRLSPSLMIRLATLASRRSPLLPPAN